MRSDQEVIEILNATPAIAAVRTSAAQQSVPVHLTGGALRDLFLGLKPRDFDFIVEASVNELARRVATDVPGGVVRLDATSGAVHYYGGELGNLHFLPANGLSTDQYLTRHSDFTVNTLLFDLQGDRIVDGYAAFADIKAQTIRGLSSTDLAAKPGHFALRAIRMALLTPTFTLGAETRAEIEARRQELSNADAADVGYELNAILQSAQYLRGITLLSELGLLQQVLTSFLPCAATAAGADSRISDDAVEATGLFSVLDELIAPCRDLVSRHLTVMRQVILLTTAMRRRGLNVVSDEGSRFLVTEGDRLEHAVNDLSARFSTRGIHAFRVRMVTVGYWRGLASLAEGTVSIEEAIESSMRTFGRRKGLLSGLLMGADWLLHERADRSVRGQINRVTDTVRRLTTDDAVMAQATR